MKLRQLVLRFLFGLSIVLTSAFSYAQAPEAGADGGGAAQPSGNAISVHVGPYLPKNFDDVDEVLKAFGVRYSLQRNTKSYWEAGISFSNSGGHSYQDISLSIRGDIPFSDMTAFGLGGLNLHRLKTAGDSDYEYHEGIHFGGGFLGHVAENVYMRIEMRGNFHPGTVLFFGFGFEMRLGGGGGGAATE